MITIPTTSQIDYETSPYYVTTNQKYRVYDTEGLDGGGRKWGSEFPRLLKPLFPDRVFDRCLEWCAGPGYCGFEMLDWGMTRTLVLGDIHAPALIYANATVAAPYNNMADEGTDARNTVSVFHISEIQDLPATEQYDLVIGNPPHSADINPRQNVDDIRVLSDWGWQAHKEFFRSIPRYLRPDGVIWLCENGNSGAGPREIFDPMIEAAGLEVFEEVCCENFDIDRNPYYYLLIGHRGAKP